MDQELDRTYNFWDAQSCREFEQFLDDWHAAQKPAWDGLDWHRQAPVVTIDLPERWPWDEEKK